MQLRVQMKFLPEEEITFFLNIYDMLQLRKPHGYVCMQHYYCYIHDQTQHYLGE